MLKTTLIAAAAVSLMAFGATDAFAGKGGGGGHHGGGHHGGKHHGGHHGWKHGRHHRGHSWSRYPGWWFNYSYQRCYYEPRKVRIRVWDRRGRPYYKWVWRDVKVC